VLESVKTGIGTMCVENAREVLEEVFSSKEGESEEGLRGEAGAEVRERGSFSRI
jgi:hypothetical protein